ncbi:hypothetical protein GT031_04165, partial [Streptomyces sp. SID2888]|nr:hypothetical protein [Streptomyces sp. SID2888]
PMRLCDRCGKRITPDEDYTTQHKQSVSAGGTTAFLHVRPCKRVQRQATRQAR